MLWYITRQPCCRVKQYEPLSQQDQQQQQQVVDSKASTQLWFDSKLRNSPNRVRLSKTRRRLIEQKKWSRMPNLAMLRKRARVRTSSNPVMGNCYSDEKVEDVSKKIVKVHQGLLEGEVIRSPDGSNCDVFLGIPYAKPPVGELRFKKPEAPEQWKGVRKCHKYPNRSIHREMPWDKALPSAPMSEDCLYLNVFAPKIHEDKKYPVMFYIHGGGWMMDSAERYSPKNVCRLLVSRGVVVVTIHYRLGYLGFLCTGDEAAHGNYGLYDMLEALKWTNANISAFGGDPDNVTICGQSAGAVSTDLLSISPLAKGLFARKIIMGGNSFCHWACRTKSEVRDYCKAKALKMGWKPKESYESTLEESKELVEFYKNIPASKLATTMFFNKPFFRECKLPLAPVIDGDILPYNLESLRESSEPVPTIVGGGEYEALLFCAIGLLRGSEKELDHVLETLAEKTGQPRSKIDEITRKLYNDSSALRSDAKLRRKFFVEILSDIFANYGNYRYMEYSKQSEAECYAYSFDHQSKQLWGWLQHVVPFTGGTHTSEVTYLFDCNYMAAPLGMTKKDRKISEMTADYFCNFVKFGTPNGLGVSPKHPEWEPISKNNDSLRVLSLKHDAEMCEKSYIERMQKCHDSVGNKQSKRRNTILQLEIDDHRNPFFGSKKNSIVSVN